MPRRKRHKNDASKTGLPAAQTPVSPQALTAAPPAPESENTPITWAKQADERRFINPYTFVPFPQSIRRQPPAGHASLRAADGTDLYMGRLDLEIKALTRLLVRDGGADGSPPTRNGTVFIPGSSVHGALRSAHETLVGGCLRIFDETFVPSYRSEAIAGINREWQLAVVEQVQTSGEDAGRPNLFTLCSQVAFIKSELVGVHGSIHSGTRWQLDKEPVATNGRDVFPSDTVLNQDPLGAWIVMLTDGRARAATKRNPNYVPYYCVMGRVSGGAQVSTVSDEAWQEYQVLARGTRDFTEAVRGTTEKDLRAREVALTKGQPQPGVPCWQYTADGGSLEQRVHTGSSPEARGYREIGWRPPHRPWLFRGQTVWVKVHKGQVTAVKASMIWRHAGQVAASNRVPDFMLPCQNPNELCPSCAMFGSINATKREDGSGARQDSYRGHVRAGDWRVLGEPVIETLALAPMGTPRMGAGQFYLNTPANTSLPDSDAIASLREWGGKGGPDDRRPLRGRKHYWRTSDRNPQPRWRARAHHVGTQMQNQAQALPAETELRGSIWFEGLTLAQVGGLIASLDPACVIDRPDGGGPLAFSLGGGKPFGFGACSVSASLADIQTAAARYLAESQPTITVDDCLQAFLGSEPTASPHWGSLAKALAMNAVDPQLVWYPPGATWEKVGTDTFDEGYEFWKRSVGRRQSRGPDKQLIQLPDVTASDQSLGIVGGET